MTTGADVKLLLFDVDGTLVLTGGAAVRAMSDAFEDVFGIGGAFEHVPMPGRTDGAILADAFTRAIPQSQILADALSANGMRPVDGEIARYKETYFRRFAEEIHKPAPADPARPTRHRFKGVLPGVREVLDALDGRSDVFLGLLTGNYEQGARIKLEYFGLWRYFRCGAYGDDSLDRHALVPIAVARAREAGCPPVEPRDVVIIGDTPFDVACARDAGVSCLAVATGGYSVDALRSAGAEMVFESLADTEAVLSALVARGDRSQKPEAGSQKKIPR
jgi:phosphoglycolate phosphatase-like HAD superfamily hydrolase